MVKYKFAMLLSLIVMIFQLSCFAFSDVEVSYIKDFVAIILPHNWRIIEVKVPHKTMLEQDNTAYGLTILIAKDAYLFEPQMSQCFNDNIINDRYTVVFFQKSIKFFPYDTRWIFLGENDEYKVYSSGLLPIDRKIQSIFSLKGADVEIVRFLEDLDAHNPFVVNKAFENLREIEDQESLFEEFKNILSSGSYTSFKEQRIVDLYKQIVNNKVLTQDLVLLYQQSDEKQKQALIQLFIKYPHTSNEEILLGIATKNNRTGIFAEVLISLAMIQSARGKQLVQGVLSEPFSWNTYYAALRAERIYENNNLPKSVKNSLGVLSQFLYANEVNIYEWQKAKDILVQADYLIVPDLLNMYFQLSLENTEYINSEISSFLRNRLILLDDFVNQYLQVALADEAVSDMAQLLS